MSWPNASFVDQIPQRPSYKFSDDGTKNSPRTWPLYILLLISFRLQKQIGNDRRNNYGQLVQDEKKNLDCMVLLAVWILQYEIWITYNSGELFFKISHKSKQFAIFK